LLIPTWDAFLTFIKQQRQTAVQRHEQWGTLPAKLQSQLDSYLPSIDHLVQFITRTKQPVLIHTDLNEENILGDWKDKESDESDWIPTSIIDFGDARVGDLLYEITPLHISTFKCEKPLLKKFFESYGLNPAVFPSFPYYAMVYTLLHDCDALSTAFHEDPDLREVQTLVELATALWDLSVSP